MDYLLELAAAAETLDQVCGHVVRRLYCAARRFQCVLILNQLGQLIIERDAGYAALELGQRLHGCRGLLLVVVRVLHHGSEVAGYFRERRDWRAIRKRSDEILIVADRRQR